MTPLERDQFWEQQVSHWQSSGLSGAAFSEVQSLTYHQFVYWRKKLKQCGPEDAVAPAGFARVAASTPGTGVGLTVSLPGGISIVGLHAGNVELLGAILRQL